MKIPPRTELTVVALTIIGALIRFWNIGFQAVNTDEEFTLAFASAALSFPQVFLNALTTDFTPPLYYLTAHLSMIFFGNTVTAIRIPSAIFGVLLIPVIYYVGKEYRDELFGLLAAGFTTFFYSMVYYSRYGRAYMLALLFFTIALYFYLQILKGDTHSSIPFGIFALLTLWTHLYSVIPLGVLVLYLLYERKAFSGIAVLVLGSLPLLNYVFLILSSRVDVPVFQNFGEPPVSILLFTPLDLFAYSSILIIPIIIWILWTHRTEKMLQIVAVTSLVTWISMIVLSFKTPIILHYALFLVPMLLLPFLLPFYDAVLAKRIGFHHLVTGMVIMLLEVVQIVAVLTMQRVCW